MRKINALVVIAIIGLFGEHSISSALYLAGILKYQPSYQITGRRVFLIVCLHLIISLFLYFKELSKRKNSKVNIELVAETKIQLISGILLAVLMGVHVILYSCYSAAKLPESLQVRGIHLIVDILFVGAILRHLAVSIPRLAISVGLVNSEKTYIKLYKIVKVILSLLGLGYMSGEVLFYFL